MPKISELRRESRRDQILAAALACFSENGFHQTGMADIVRRSGISHGAVYVYFPSKEDIIEALADDRHQREAILNSVVRKTKNSRGFVRCLRLCGLGERSGRRGEAPRRNQWLGAEALRNSRVHARVIEGIRVPHAILAELLGQARV